MKILKLALLGTLRIAFFGAVKVALFAYMLSLPDTALASPASEDNVPMGNETLGAMAESNAIGDAGAGLKAAGSLELATGQSLNAAG